MVVMTFLLCHSLRYVTNETNMTTTHLMLNLFLPRLVAKMYQVIILDDYLEERRWVSVWG